MIMWVEWAYMQEPQVKMKQKTINMMGDRCQMIGKDRDNEKNRKSRRGDAKYRMNIAERCLTKIHWLYNEYFLKWKQMKYSKFQRRFQWEVANNSENNDINISIDGKQLDIIDRLLEGRANHIGYKESHEWENLAIDTRKYSNVWRKVWKENHESYLEEEMAREIKSDKYSKREVVRVYRWKMMTRRKMNKQTNVVIMVLTQVIRLKTILMDVHEFIVFGENNKWRR